ncbi:MAG: hypothetical protein WC823_06180 [Parcubacteria group bacterium]|jgi:type II secretory pathway pseudopilin PulG
MTHRQQTINPRAFSLIEVLFSIVMFTVGILGVVSLINQSMVASMNRRNETIAGQLAQEGIELVRNIRDNNWLNDPDHPFQNIGNRDDGIIDYNPATEVVGNGGNFNLHINDDGLYEHGTAQEFFQRRIIITGDDANKTIKSIVTWGGNTPTDSPSEDSCSPATKCFYTEVTLNGVWGINIAS